MELFEFESSLVFIASSTKSSAERPSQKPPPKQTNEVLEVPSGHSLLSWRIGAWVPASTRLTPAFLTPVPGTQCPYLTSEAPGIHMIYMHTHKINLF